MLIDNNIWYARVGIFNFLIRYVFLSVRHCRDINFFINLLNKTYLALLLWFLIFCLGVTVLFLFIYFSLAPFLYQNRFYSYTSNETSFLVSLHCLSGKPSLNYSVSRRFPLLTYIRSLICTSCIWNKILLIQSGDVELNPGPKKSTSLSFFHWNLNGIAAHAKIAKISLILSHALFYNINIIFLSETFLDSSIETNNLKLNIPGYALLQSDHPSNIKRGGVCMFYKDYLPVIRRDDLCALTECIVAEVNLGTKSLFFTCNYRYPSQTVDEFESYCQNPHLTLTNIDDTSPFSSVLIVDFNAGCTNWWAADINSKAGKELDTLTSTARYTQLIDKPTHFFSGGCSCIDLIFWNKPELISVCGIDHSLFQTCHHNLIFANINAKIPVHPSL